MRECCLHLFPTSHQVMSHNSLKLPAVKIFTPQKLENTISWVTILSFPWIVRVLTWIPLSINEQLSLNVESLKNQADTRKAVRKYDRITEP